jgi:hypothetical protein
MNDELGDIIHNLLTRTERLEQTLVLLISFLSKSSIGQKLYAHEIQQLGEILSQKK